MVGQLWIGLQHKDKLMGCCSQNVRLQKTRNRFTKPPESLPNGAIKLSKPPKENLVGYVADQADPTILRPEHPPCSHFMSQGMLEQDGGLSILTLCMSSDSAFQGRTPMPSDCRDCPAREPPRDRRSLQSKFRGT